MAPGRDDGDEDLARRGGAGAGGPGGPVARRAQAAAALDSGDAGRLAAVRGADPELSPGPMRDDPESRSALGVAHEKPAVALLSHRVSPAVPSPKRGLTSEFGMGSGVAPALWTAGKTCSSEADSRRPPRRLIVDVPCQQMLRADTEHEQRLTV